MAKLRVTRKSHKRGPYHREDGTLVAGANVPKSTFLIKDRGVPGRTPEEKKFFKVKVYTGWKADMPMGKRRRLVLKAHKSDALASGRSMIQLANVSHRINPDVSRKARTDALYFFAKNRASKN